MKRYLTAVLIFLFTFPNVYAQFSGGSGTKDNPYRIETPVQLSSIRHFPDKHFVLIKNIDFSNTRYSSINGGWNPIEKFSGSLDGNNHKIKNLFIRNPVGSSAALIGFAESSMVQNIGIVDCRIEGSGTAGALVGSQKKSSIINCYVTGSLEGGTVGGLVGYQVQSGIRSSYADIEIKGGRNVGGLVGHSYNCGIERSYARGKVNGETNVGGLVGDMTYIGSISQSFADVQVNGKRHVGGLVGNRSRCGFNPSIIKNCYSVSNVAGEQYVGGLAGGDRGSCYSTDRIKANCCYAAGKVSGQKFTGGLVGGPETIGGEGNYWDTEASGKSSSAGRRRNPLSRKRGNGNGRTTEQMKTKSTYKKNSYKKFSWDWDSVWGIKEDVNEGYPYLLNVPGGESSQKGGS